jgi:hypothetical protein
MTLAIAASVDSNCITLPGCSRSSHKTARLCLTVESLGYSLNFGAKWPLGGQIPSGAIISAMENAMRGLEAFQEELRLRVYDTCGQHPTALKLRKSKVNHW